MFKHFGPPDCTHRDPVEHFGLPGYSDRDVDFDGTSNWVLGMSGHRLLQNSVQLGMSGHRHLEKLSTIFNVGAPALGKIRHINVMRLVGAPRAMIYA